MNGRRPRELGTLLPALIGTPPGSASLALGARLRRAESRNVTYLSERFPVFWDEAAGANVRDADGNVYIDLTGAFGVALAGHSHPRITEAVRRQAGRLVHAMGDVHPPTLKVEVLERLAGLTPWPECRGVLASTGSEAVEIALKTALLATDRPGILAFEGGYHGLTLGALAPTARPYFREPFARRLYGGVARAPFPDPLRQGEGCVELCLERVGELLEEGAPGGDAIGAVLVEPVQGRAGVRIPPPGFLEGLSRLAREHGALVVADEVFTGMGRCGSPLASELLGLDADIVCLGKALGGGLPLSACLAPARVMDAWPPSPGEALHTSTFLGHPLGCAAALAVLDLLERGLAREVARAGEDLRDGLSSELGGVPAVAEVRGVGGMVGIELVEADGVSPATGLAARVAESCLAEGLMVLPAGDDGHVVELAPPAALTGEQTTFAVGCLGRCVRGVVG